MEVSSWIQNLFMTIQEKKKISLAPASNQTMSPQSIRSQHSHCNAYTIMAPETVTKFEISAKFI